MSKYKYPARIIGDDSNQGEIPLDKNNHLPDAIRYMLGPFPQFPENPEEFSSVWNSTLLRFQNSRTPSELSYFNDNSSEYVNDFLDNFS